MRVLGCLGVLLVLAGIAAEVAAYIVVSRWLKANVDWVGSGYLEAAILIVCTTWLGVVMAKRHLAKLPAAFMGSMMGQDRGAAGRHLVGLVGAILLALPGLLSDVIGLLLLLPPIQGLLSGLGQRVLAGIVRQQLQRMGGGMPFPGMAPRGSLTPDDRIPRGPRTYDTVAEKE